MKRNALLLAGLMLLCTGCSAKEPEPVETEPVTEAVEETTEATEAPTDPPRDVKEYHFAKIEDAQELPVDEMLYILSHEYYSNDFVDLEQYDFFDKELVETTDEFGYEVFEQFAVEIPQTETLLEELDVTKPFDSGQIGTIARERSHAMVGDTSGIAPSAGADEPSRTVSDVEYIFCGENDSYCEYSIRYNELQRQSVGEAVVPVKYPRYYRRMYLKNFVEASDGKRNRQVLLGKLSEDYVRQQLDLLVDHTNSRVLFREVTKETDDNGETYYNYVWVHIDRSQGTYGWNPSAVLARSRIVIYAEDHILDRKVDAVLNEVKLDNTTVAWPQF